MLTPAMTSPEPERGQPSRPLLTLPLPLAVTGELAAEIEKQSVYVSAGIARMRVSLEDREVLVELTGRDDGASAAKAERFLASMLASLDREVEVKVLVRNRRRNPAPLERNVYRKLIERGWVVELGHGQVALSGPALELARKLSAICAKLGRDAFGGIEREYPTLIPTEALARCGYISSFPQNLSMVTRLREDFDGIETFRRANSDNRSLHIPEVDAVVHPEACLCPALCYHCYPTLAGQKLAPTGHVETAIGRICRYESSNITGLDRLWEFTQRSIIWVGADPLCTELRQRAIDAAAAQLEDWDIDATIETASDPFFASVTTAKSLWQRSQDLKFELRAVVEPSSSVPRRTIAAASFNLHGTYFGHAFDIESAELEPASSGCVSWGLERWVLVVFTQHGFDPRNWPVALRL
jgi:seryl-tRNA synthetase